MLSAKEKQEKRAELQRSDSKLKKLLFWKKVGDEAYNKKMEKEKEEAEKKKKGEEIEMVGATGGVKQVDQDIFFNEMAGIRRNETAFSIGEEELDDTLVYDS